MVGSDVHWGYGLWFLTHGHIYIYIYIHLKTLNSPTQHYGTGEIQLVMGSLV